MSDQPLEFEAALEKLFAGECDFVAGAARLEQLPPDTLPEVAFAGRSNVGKSSLINALLGRKRLVRTSRHPGQTAQLNFFEMPGKMAFVDMPGYGFAKVSKAERALWDQLISTYLCGRASLRRVFVLVDSRHGLKPTDEEVMGMLDGAAVSFQVVLTKADKLNMSEQTRCVAEVQAALKKHPAALPEVVLTSSEARIGLEQVRASIVAATGLLGGKA